MLLILYPLRNNNYTILLWGLFWCFQFFLWPVSSVFSCPLPTYIGIVIEILSTVFSTYIPISGFFSFILVLFIKFNWFQLLTLSYLVSTGSWYLLGVLDRIWQIHSLKYPIYSFLSSVKGGCLLSFLIVIPISFTLIFIVLGGLG